MQQLASALDEIDRLKAELDRAKAAVPKESSLPINSIADSVAKLRRAALKS